ncbi:Outer membrane efflux protein [Bacteroidales bacterium Barb4]|nr:Outer membrane efflux protein [Bacteroidales bacterium Barb4]
MDSELYALNERVNRLFFGCLLQDELIRRNELLQKEWQINLDRIEAMTENGTANLSDCESVEVELLNARQKAVELEASRAAFGQMLAALTGLSVEGIVLEMPPLPNNNFSVEINRPELRAFEAQSALAEARNRQIDAGLMPRAGAFVQGGYGRPGLNMLEDGFGAFYVAGLRLSWNIGKLYTLKSDRSKVGIALKEIDARRETFLFNTRLQLLQEDTEIHKTQALVQSDEDIIRLRTRLKEAAEAKLANGVISVTDLIREINAEDMARQSVAVHRIQQLMAAYAKRLTVND